MQLIDKYKIGNKLLDKRFLCYLSFPSQQEMMVHNVEQWHSLSKPFKKALEQIRVRRITMEVQWKAN